MVHLTSTKIMECIDVEKITNETVTLNIDGEKLRQQLYDDLKFKTTTDYGDDVPAVYFQDAPFAKFYPNEVFDEEACKQLAIELTNRLNSQIKTKLNIKD